MGLFDGLKLKKQRKEKDRIIKQAEDLREQRNYQGAMELLGGILFDDFDEDEAYRIDEIRKLYTFCKMIIEENTIAYQEKRAENGDVEAMFRVATKYQESGEDHNPEKAFYWMKKAAETGYIPAMYRVAMFYQNGTGTDVNLEQAAIWYKKVTECNLGTYIELAEDKLKEIEAAQKTQSEKAVEIPQEPAQVPENEILNEIDGKDGQTWHKEAMEYYHDKKYTQALLCAENAAKLGVVEAMHDTAAMYRMGMGTQADEAKAFYWFEKAANAGDSRAMFETSLCYFYGTGVAKDDDKAHKWLDAALDAGEVEAFQFMSQIFYESAEKNNNPEDYESSLHWAELAARGGHEDAKRNLDQLYLNCHRNEMNKKQPDLDRVIYYTDGLMETDIFPTLSPDLQIGFLCATAVTLMKYSNNKAYGEYILRYLELTAELGDTESMNILSALWLTGEYIERDEEKSFHWRKKAAEHGLTSAMIALGEYYEDGVGVEKNPEEALYWYEKAVENGDEEAYLHCAMIILQNTEVRGYTLEEAIEHFKYWQDKAVNCENEEVRNRNLEVMKELGFIK